MRNLKNGKLGILEKTIIEFKNKGISSIEEIRTHLINTYNLTVSRAILQKRLEGLPA